MNLIGYNANAVLLGDKTYFLEHMGRLKPPSMVIMDGLGVAGDVVDATGGQTIVKHRLYEDGDSVLWERYTPEEYARKVTNNFTSRHDVWYYISNEPGPHGEDITKCCNWHIEHGKIMETEGYHCGLGNMGAAVWTPDEIESGRFDDYLGWGADWSARGVHTLDWHEYSIHPAVGVGLLPIEALLDREQIAPEKWPYRQPQVDWYEVRQHYAQAQAQRLQARAQGLNIIYPPNWHILRYRWFQLYAIEKGIGKHKCHITEGIFDRMPDLTKLTNNIYTELQNRFGMPNNAYGDPYPYMRGQHTYAKVWEYYHPELTYEEYLFLMFLYIMQIYPEDEVLGVDIFTWSRGSWDWDKLHGYDVSRLFNLHRMLEYQASLPTLPIVEPEPEPDPIVIEPEPEPDPDDSADAEDEIEQVSPLTCGLVAFMFFILFAIASISSIIARIDVLTVPVQSLVGEGSMEIPTVTEAGVVLVTAILAVIQAGLVSPITVPLVNLLKYLFSLVGLGEAKLLSGNMLSLYAAAGVTFVVWISRQFGVESQTQTLLSTLSELIPLAMTLLGAVLGQKTLFAFSQKVNLPGFGYTRSQKKNVTYTPETAESAVTAALEEVFK